MIEFGIAAFIFLVIIQIVFTNRGVSKAQDRAIEALQEGNMECDGYLHAVIGDIFGYHLLGTEDGWNVFDENGDLVVCAANVKMSLVHRWKQKRLERMADRYYEDKCLSFDLRMM